MSIPRKIFFFICSIILFSCKSSIKQQKDEIYSRHLQRSVTLTVITTPMPDNKEEMNLLVFCGKPDAALQIKETADSLYKNKLMQPLTIVCIQTESKDCGFESGRSTSSNNFRKFNAFVMNELYPYAKKKSVLRKFHSVAVCGYDECALAAFDIAWNNNDKITAAGIFYPDDHSANTLNDSAAIRSNRKRPELFLYLIGDTSKPVLRAISEKLSTAKNEMNFELIPVNKNSVRVHTANEFKDFLMKTFPR